MQVDLTLAVNYLPACACLCKLFLLMLAIGLVQPGDEVRGGYIPLAATLYIDRAITRNLIFDANAILLAVFFANVHATVRDASPKEGYWFFLWGLHMCWITQCLMLIYEPNRIRWFLEKRVQASKAIPLLLLLMVLTGTAYIHCPLEPAPFRACRAMAFTLLSFTWIYVVGIHTSQGLEYLKETSSQFIVRLAPVLYSPPWLTGFFLVGAVAGLVLQYSRRFQPPEPSSAPEEQASPAQTAPPEPRPSPEPPEDAQLHELFRQAKLSSSRRPFGLDPVFEDKSAV